MRGTAGPITAILLMVPMASGAAEPCDPNLIPAGGSNHYQKRPSGLCEGLYASRVGAPPIELVSLTRGAAPSAPASLDLSIPGSAGTGAVRLRGTGVPNGLYYRLDADITPGKPLRWPANEVVGALGLSMTDIGLYAFAEDATGTKIYIPVELGAASPSSGDVAEFRTADLVDDLRWRLISATGQANGIAWHNVDAAGDRLSIQLPQGGGMLEVGWSDQQTGEPKIASFRIDQ